MNHKKTIEELFKEGTPIDAALARAEYNMALEHRRQGTPIVVWRDGKIVHMSADEVLAILDRERTSRTTPESPAA